MLLCTSTSKRNCTRKNILKKHIKINNKHSKFFQLRPMGLIYMLKVTVILNAYSECI